MKLQLTPLHNADVMVNTALSLNDNIAVVTEIKKNIATVFDGKSYHQISVNKIVPMRLSVVNEIKQTGKFATLTKTVYTNLDFSSFKYVIALNANKEVIDGVTVKVFKPVRINDAVKIDLNVLSRKLPELTGAVLRDAVGLVLSIDEENKKYNVMILNNTFAFDRQDLINQNVRNTKYLFKLSDACMETATKLIESATLNPAVTTVSSEEPTSPITSTEDSKPAKKK